MFSHVFFNQKPRYLSLFGWVTLFAIFTFLWVGRATAIPLTPTTIVDNTFMTAVNDGTINGGEYVGSSAGINSGFGDVLGASSVLHIDSDTTGNLNLGLQAGGVITDPNAIVIYIDTDDGATGFANTGGFTDTADNCRRAISGFDGINRSTLTFASGFSANYAICIDGSFAGLWQLMDGGTHPFVTSVNRTTVTANDYEFNLMLADLGLTPGDSFRYVATYLNQTNAFRSDEFHGVAAFAGGNPGQNPATLSVGDFNTFTSIAANAMPVAVDDWYVTDRNTTLNVSSANGVLLNDSDPDGDALTASLVTNVSNGTLTFNSDGSFDYVPDADFTGMVTFTYRTTDNMGTGLEFDGVDDHVNAGNDPSIINSTGDMTISAWFKMGADFAGFRALLTMEQDAPPVDGYFQMMFQDGRLRVDDSNNMPVTFSPGTYNDGQWHFVTYVRDATLKQGRVYMDGQLIGSNFYTVDGLIPASTDLMIGAAVGLPDNRYYYNGVIDEVRVWNTVRTPAEIANDRFRALTGTEPGLVAYYRLDDGTGSMMAVDSASSNDGTLVNMDAGTDWVNSIHSFSNEATVTIFVPPIVINEIIQNPAVVADASGEWFEVYNAGTTDIDLDGWTIMDNDTDSHVISGTVIVPADGYGVLCTNGVTTTNGNVPCDYVYGSNITLANGADEVVILNSMGVEMDRVEYDGGPLFPDPNGASMCLTDPDLDNNVGVNWNTSTAPFGAGDAGTPGAANNDCMIAAVDDNYSTNEDTLLTVPVPGVMSNDTNVTSVVLESGPTSGTLDLQPDGSFVYTPTADFYGVATFTYIGSYLALTDTATVTITVVSVPEAMLAVSKDSMVSGNTIHYTIAVTNSGDLAATTTITDVFPVGVTNVSCVGRSTLTSPNIGPGISNGLTSLVLNFDTTGILPAGAILESVSAQVVGFTFGASYLSEIDVALFTPIGIAGSVDFGGDFGYPTSGGSYDQLIGPYMAGGSAEGVYQLIFTEDFNDGGDDQQVSTAILTIGYRAASASSGDLMETVVIPAGSTLIYECMGNTGLSIDKTPDISTVMPGDDVTFTVDINNYTGMTVTAMIDDPMVPACSVASMDIAPGATSYTCTDVGVSSAYTNVITLTTGTSLTLTNMVMVSAPEDTAGSHMASVMDNIMLWDRDEAVVNLNMCGANPAVAVMVSMAISGADATLNWTDDPANLGGYAIYRSASPYFTADGTTLYDSVAAGISSYTDSGAVGMAGVNYYYRVVALNCDGSQTATSNDTAEFDFAIVPGS